MRGEPLNITRVTLASQAAHDTFKDTDVSVLFGIVSDPIGAGIVPLWVSLRVLILTALSTPFLEM